MAYVRNKPARHPANNKKNADNLEAYVFSRVEETHSELRTELIEKFRYIDQQVNTFLKLNDDDRKRMQDRLEGKGIKPTDVNLPLVFSQLDDAATFIMDVFAPNNEIFQSVSSTAEEQKVTNAFVDLLNNHAQEGRYYRQFLKSIFAGLKYNMGAYEIYWDESRGTTLGNREDGQLDVRENEITGAMNKLKALDMYNFMWDLNSELVDIPYEAEWAANCEIMTRFHMERLHEGGQVYNLDKLEKIGEGVNKRFYQVRPYTREYLQVRDPSNAFDWYQYVKILQSDSGRRERDISLHGKYEIVKWTGWLKPNDFGLGTENKLKLWRLIYVTNDSHKTLIWDAEKTDAHGLLPVCANMPIESELKLDQKSYGEHLMPFQVFSSFLMNSHQRAVRKALYGLTVYNPQVIDISQLGEDSVGAIPYNPNVYDKPIRDAFAQYYDAPGTEQNMQQVGDIQALMQYILPSDQRQTVQNLQRATEYQAAAAVQGQNRRSYKIAKLIDVQQHTPAKVILLNNIKQYQEAMEIVNQRGELVEINPSQFRSQNIYYHIGSTLKGLDKLLTITILEKTLNSIIQNAEAIQHFDVPGLLNYLSSLAGEDADLTRFARQVPTQTLQQQREAGGQPDAGNAEQ